MIATSTWCRVIDNSAVNRPPPLSSYGRGQWTSILPRLEQS
jgi:hypothetical protein